ncbi:Protein TRANSPARENT TESTA 12 [Hordeum vulgare]|nr:Protein TRANSPARENT TESTA 12 [Hordeum vulgare]
MARRYCLTGRSPGSIFGLTRRVEESGSLMTMSVLRMHRPSGVSCCSGLTGSNAGDPEEREPEPEPLDDEYIAVSILLDVEVLPWRLEKVGSGG